MKFATLIASSLFALAAAMPAAAAHEVEYATTLSGASEIPPNGSSGTGNALITVDFDTLMMEVKVSFSDLSGTTTASHIHCCTATPGSGNVGVATVLPTFTDFPLGVTSGTYDHTFDMALASSYNPDFVTAHSNVSGAFSALIAGMESGNAYLNIHTSAFPGGEVRGLLHAVPEPEAYALLVVGLVALGWRARRRFIKV
jgi:CHRD domain/PEP-CTERM motif